MNESGTKNKMYSFLYLLVWPFFNFVHPCRVIGRENIPAGGALICANHFYASDPFFIAFAFRLCHQLRVMAKAELIRVPIIGWLLNKAGIFGVERGKGDVAAIKTAMRYLKDGNKVLLFPEGTRAKAGEALEAKTGAAMLALRTGVPIVPVYVPSKHKWFGRTPVVIGEAYFPQTAGKRATAEEYQVIADDLMCRIKALAPEAGL